MSGKFRVLESPARALIVHAERFFRQAICEVLEREGIAASAAENGERAVAEVRGGGIGVVVLDLQLREPSGAEVLEQLLLCDASLRVIVLSAHGDQERVLEALRRGACEYLAKPIHEEELVLAVRRAREAYAALTSAARLRARIELLATRLAACEELISSGEQDARERFLDAALSAAEETAGAHKASFMLLDSRQELLRVAVAHGHDRALAEFEPVRVGEGVAGRAVASRTSIVVDDVERDPRFAGRGSQERYRSPAFAVVPLLSKDRALGCLCATERDEPFDAATMALLRILALQVSSHLEPEAGVEQPVPSASAQPWEEQTERLVVAEDPSDAERDSELAREICEAVSGELAPERVLEAVLRCVGESLDAEPCSLYLRVPGGDSLRLEGQWNGGMRDDRPELPLRRGLCGVVFETGQPVAAPRPEEDARFDVQTDTPADGEVAPLLCVPVRFRRRMLGLFRAFPRAEVVSARTAEVLTSALSAAVRNILLYRSLVETMDEVARARREVNTAQGMPEERAKTAVGTDYRV